MRDNVGRWQIESEAVDDWMSLRRTSDRQSPDMSTGQKTVTPLDSPETLVRVAVLEAENGHLRERLDELRQERDAWRTQAEQLLLEARATGFRFFDRLERLFRRKD